jgi:hypothetical protein
LISFREELKERDPDGTTGIFEAIPAIDILYMTILSICGFEVW